MADRHQFRAEWLDYDNGIFFVTVCCGDKRHYFGEISDGEMHYTTAGQIVRTTVDQIVYHFSGVEMWNSVIMPNRPTTLSMARPRGHPNPPLHTIGSVA